MGKQDREKMEKVPNTSRTIKGRDTANLFESGQCHCRVSQVDGGSGGEMKMRLPNCRGLELEMVMPGVGWLSEGGVSLSKHMELSSVRILVGF